MRQAFRVLPSLKEWRDLRGNYETLYLDSELSHDQSFTVDVSGFECSLRFSLPGANPFSLYCVFGHLLASVQTSRSFFASRSHRCLVTSLPERSQVWGLAVLPLRSCLKPAAPSAGRGKGLSSILDLLELGIMIGIAVGIRDFKGQLTDGLSG